MVLIVARICGITFWYFSLCGTIISMVGPYSCSTCKGSPYNGDFEMMMRM
jgi:hypothetical protein